MNAQIFMRTKKPGAPEPSASYLSVLQRRCVCGGHTPDSGESAGHHPHERALGLKAKSRVSQPDDPDEREADRVADQVMGMPKHPTERSLLLSQRIQRQTSSDNTITVPPVVHDVLRSSGQPLDAATQAFMESHFGDDFSRVRVHTDSIAAKSARELSAEAYAVGTHIVFGSGRYMPNMPAGRHLLAHELTHVVQQRGVDSLINGQPNKSSNGVIQRQAAAAAMAVADWVAVGTLGYTLTQNAVSATAGDISYSFDEMEGVLLPGGGNDVAAYRAAHPNTNIRTYTHTVATWMGFRDSRRMGIKFGITFNYDGHAIGNISCRILDTYDWPFWEGSVHVNFTPISLSRGDVAIVRITLNLNADRTLRGGAVESRVLALDGTGEIRKTGGGAWVKFN